MTVQSALTIFFLALIGKSQGLSTTNGVHRRALLKTIPAIGVAQAVGVSAATKKTVVVVGGDGFVGQSVCEQLVALGSSVISVSRNPKPPASAPWSSEVRYVRGDALTDDLNPIFKGADAVVSCVGALGSDDDARNNGETNERIAIAAKAAGATRFAYVSVHPLVSDAAADIFPDYLAGKKRAEAAIRSNFPDACIIRPTLIYGGDKFNVNPPRVPTAYGSFVDATLSSGPLRAFADAASPLPALKLALLPPVDVSVTGKALALAAISETSPPRDVIGKDQIVQLALL